MAAKYKLTLDEQETIISWAESDETALLTTCKKPIINKLRKLGATELRSDDGFLPITTSFEVPISWIKINKPRTRSMTDEQRQRASDRLKLARQSIL